VEDKTMKAVGYIVIASIIFLLGIILAALIQMGALIAGAEAQVIPQYTSEEIIRGKAQAEIEQRQRDEFDRVQEMQRLNDQYTQPRPYVHDVYPYPPSSDQNQGGDTDVVR
jgi:hypothetical protein